MTWEVTIGIWATCPLHYSDNSPVQTSLAVCPWRVRLDYGIRELLNPVVLSKFDFCLLSVNVLLAIMYCSTPRYATELSGM